MACPPEAAASFTTENGENVLWPDRLSSSTVSELPPLVLLLEDDEELLLDDEDEEDELELLELDDELEELLLDDELLELEDDELELLEVPSPAQVGAAKLPSWLPWKPKPVL
jgi:hypothetical protein